MIKDALSERKTFCSSQHHEMSTANKKTGSKKSFTKSIMSSLAIATLAASATSAFAFQEDELVIWVGGDKAYTGIREIGEQFAKDTGIKVKVEIPENLTDRFQQASASGSGPDILFWAHDRYGEWAKSGLLAPIDPPKKFRQGIDDIGWQAMTYNGKTYGYPISMEAVSLIYNKDIIPQAPKSFESMFALNKELKKKDKKTIMWDQVQPYFTMPMLAANGGYVFKQTKTGYNTKALFYKRYI